MQSHPTGWDNPSFLERAPLMAFPAISSPTAQRLTVHTLCGQSRFSTEELSEEAALVCQATRSTRAVHTTSGTAIHWSYMEHSTTRSLMAIQAAAEITLRLICELGKNYGGLTLQG